MNDVGFEPAKKMNQPVGREGIKISAYGDGLSGNGSENGFIGYRPIGMDEGMNGMTSGNEFFRKNRHMHFRAPPSQGGTDLENA